MNSGGDPVGYSAQSIGMSFTEDLRFYAVGLVKNYNLPALGRYNAPSGAADIPRRREFSTDF